MSYKHTFTSIQASWQHTVLQHYLHTNCSRWHHYCTSRCEQWVCFMCVQWPIPDHVSRGLLCPPSYTKVINSSSLTHLLTHSLAHLIHTWIYTHIHIQRCVRITQPEKINLTRPRYFSLSVCLSVSVCVTNLLQICTICIVIKLGCYKIRTQ